MKITFGERERKEDNKYGCGYRSEQVSLPDFDLLVVQYHKHLLIRLKCCQSVEFHEKLAGTGPSYPIVRLACIMSSLRRTAAWNCNAVYS